MRFVPLFIFCSLMYGWGTLAPTEAQLPWDRQFPQVPEVKAQMVVPPLAVGPVDRPHCALLWRSPRTITPILTQATPDCRSRSPSPSRH